MVIKLKRMIKLNGAFIPTNAIIDVPTPLANELIDSKAAVAVSVAVKAAVHQDTAVKDDSIKTESSKQAGIKKVAESIAQKAIDLMKNLAPETEKPVETDTVDSDDDEGDDADADTVDLSNFTVVEDLPPVELDMDKFAIPGISNDAQTALKKAGYESIDSLKGVTVEQLVKLPKIGYTNANKIVDYVKGF